jgi:hypothetical protein
MTKNQDIQLTGLSVSNLQAEIAKNLQEIQERKLVIRKLDRQIRQRVKKGIDSTNDPVIDLIYRLKRVPHRSRHLIKHLRDLAEALTKCHGELIILEIHRHFIRHSAYSVGIIRPAEEFPLYPRSHGDFVAVKCIANDHTVTLHQTDLNVLGKRLISCQFGTPLSSEHLEPEMLFAPASEDFFRFWIGNQQAATLLRTFGRFQEDQLNLIKRSIAEALNDSEIAFPESDPLTIALDGSKPVEVVVVS